MRWGARRRRSFTSPRRGRAHKLVGVAALCAAAALAPTFVAADGAAAHGGVHYACSKPNSALIPCYFSTPSGNIHCLWTPTSKDVTCELLASHRAYRLSPGGKAKSVKVRLSRGGETLPTSQTLVFPMAISCLDTRASMTCAQGSGHGFFKLAKKGSRSH